MNELQRYFAIINQIRSGQPPTDDDLQFFVSYSPQIDESKLQKIAEGGQFTSTEDARNAIVEVGRLLQSSPEYREKILGLAEQAEGKELSQKLSDGINMILGVTDIAASANQINAAERAERRSRRPVRPAVPGRDQLLAQALRAAQEDVMDPARAIAPAQAQIEDQYQADVAGARTASTGQAGAYGAYMQAAANRRNRAALDLVPMQDQVKRANQQRFDNLLGMRMDETQQMYRNQAALYPYELAQYGREQEAIANLGMVGRSNLRNSLYNLGSAAADAIPRTLTARRYDQLRNRALATGLNPDIVAAADRNLRSNLTSDDTPYWEQMY